VNGGRNRLKITVSQSREAVKLTVAILVFTHAGGQQSLRGVGDKIWNEFQLLNRLLSGQNVRLLMSPENGIAKYHSAIDLRSIGMNEFWSVPKAGSSFGEQFSYSARS